MAMHMLQVVVSNTFADLDDNSGSNLFFSTTDPIGVTNWSSSKSSSRIDQALLQSSAVASSEPIYSRKSKAPLPVKIAALETLEVLLNVGGSFSACYWRTETDLLLINVARDSCYKAGMYEETPPSIEDPIIPDFQLASLKALLASFLSCPHERPPYLAQGLELFNRGKLETGTELAKFCSHALLALDVLVHRRGLRLQYVPKGLLPPERAAHAGLGPRSAAPEESVLDSRRHKHPCYVHKRRIPDNLGDEVSDWLLSTDDEPPDALVEDTSVEKHDAVELSKDPVMQKDTIIEGHREIVSYRLPGQVQDVATPIRTDLEMADACTKERDGSCSYANVFDTLGNPPGSFKFNSAPINIALQDPQNPEDSFISNEKRGYHWGIVSGDTSSSHNVPGLTSPIFAAPTVSGSAYFSAKADLDPDSD